jgi:hypothetical protein
MANAANNLPTNNLACRRQGLYRIKRNAWRKRGRFLYLYFLAVINIELSIIVFGVAQMFGWKFKILFDYFDFIFARLDEKNKAAVFAGNSGGNKFP